MEIPAYIYVINISKGMSTTERCRESSMPEDRWHILLDSVLYNHFWLFLTGCMPRYLRKSMGQLLVKEMYVDLDRKVHQFNDEQGQLCAKMEVTPDQQTIVAICTPLMQRVHESFKSSGEMIFVDSSGNCDRHNSRIFLVLTHSPAGGLPLGMLVTTSESTPTIEAAFRLLQSVLPERAFFGRGVLGPQVVMTDDCTALRQGLHAVYPEACLILCIFHLK